MSSEDETKLPSTFESNAEAFKRELPKLLESHRDKHALFHGNKFVSAYDTFEAAFEAAIDRFGTDPIFIGFVNDDPISEDVPALFHGLIRACP